MVQPLEGSIRMYPWGSRTALAQMAGRPSPSPHPEAEMWFGAHPGAPAYVDGEPLDVLIASDSVAALGASISMAYHGELPFLLKLLAADAPLSLQAHPTKDQAVEGFAREDTLGIARDALNRNYKDDNHKPELIVALTDFDAMCGFSSVDRILRLFDALQVADLERYRMMLSGVVESEGLRSLVTTWITLPAGPRADLIAAVADGARAYLETAATQRGDGDAADDPIARVTRNIVSLAERYPNDPGVLCALLLNHVRLRPGEGIYLDAGQLHAYLNGFGVEIMANSDNVLRGGLTSKHIDVPELVRVLTFEPLSDPVIRPVPLTLTSPGVDGCVYPTPAPEFRLERWTLNPGAEVVLDREGPEPTLNGPAIVLCTSGHAELDAEFFDGFGAQTLTPSRAAWIPAEQDDVRVAAQGDEPVELFVATVAQR